MIRTAYPVYEGKVAPFFDAATELRVVTLDEGSRYESSSSFGSPLIAMRARELAIQGVDVLFCNTISASQAVIVRALGIRIERWVGSNLEAHISEIAHAERTANGMPKYSYDRLTSDARFRRPARRYVGQPHELLEKVA